MVEKQDISIDSEDMDLQRERDILAQMVLLRGQEYCSEYEPAYPVTRHNGMCKFYLKLRRPCGKPFINSQVCKCGVIDRF